VDPTYTLFGMLLAVLTTWVLHPERSEDGVKTASGDAE
jgi:hypothetical protein